MEKINENENFYRMKIRIKKAYCQIRVQLFKAPIKDSRLMKKL